MRGQLFFHLPDALRIRRSTLRIRSADFKQLLYIGEVSVFLAATVRRINLLCQRRGECRKTDGVTGRIPGISRKAEASKQIARQILCDPLFDCHDLVHALCGFGCFQIGADRLDACGIACIPVKDVVVQRSDTLRVLSLRVGNRLPDQRVQRLGVIHFFCERTGLRLTGRNDRAVQPALVDCGIEVILQIAAEQGIRAVDEQIKLIHGNRIIWRESSLRGAGNNAGGEYICQLRLRPSGYICEVGRRVTFACVITLWCG